MKLNLGSGANLFEGWTNVDIDDVEETYLRHLRSAENVESWPEWQRKQWGFLKSGGHYSLVMADFMVETTLFGRVSESSCDAIYLGQVVEHLNAQTELPALLRWCHHALKPGGVLRMTTPDLDRILGHYENGRMGEFSAEQPGYYANASPEAQLSFLMFGATGPNCTRKNYEGHFHIWTKPDLARACTAAGLVYDNNDWPSKRLPDVRDFGESHSFALEVCK